MMRQLDPNVARLLPYLLALESPSATFCLWSYSWCSMLCFLGHVSQAGAAACPEEGGHLLWGIPRPKGHVSICSCQRGRWEGRKPYGEFYEKTNTQAEWTASEKTVFAFQVLTLKIKQHNNNILKISTEMEERAKQTHKQSNFGKGINSHKTLSMLNSNMLIF